MWGNQGTREKGCGGAGGDFGIEIDQYKDVAFTRVIRTTGNWVKISDQGTGIRDPVLEDAFG